MTQSRPLVSPPGMAAVIGGEEQNESTATAETIWAIRSARLGSKTAKWLERLIVTLRGGLFLNKTAKRVSGASYSQSA
jgi:hypothetical protein